MKTSLRFFALFALLVANAWSQTNVQTGPDGTINSSKTDIKVGAGYTVRVKSGGSIIAEGGSTVTGFNDGALRVGSGVPAGGLGLDGDTYLRLDSPFGLYRKAAGAWTLQATLVDASGSYTDPAWLTLTKAKVGLGNVPNVDATNASNIATGTLPNARLSAVPNSALANSGITIAGNSTALGGTVTQDQITGLASTGLVKRTGANALAIAVAGTDYLAPSGSGTGLSGVTFSAIVPNTAPAAGQLLVGNAGGTAYAPVALSGDVTVTSAGVTAIGASKVTNAMLAGSIANAKLSNSAITVAGNSTALGGTVTQDQITGLASTGLVMRTGANALAIAVAGTDYLAPGGSGTGLSGVTFSAIVPNTAPAAGGLLIGNAGGTAYAPVALSGDVTVSSAGVSAIGASKVTNGMLAGSIDLTTKVSGILPSANGGTGFGTYTIGDLLYASGASVLSKLPAVASGQVLSSAGTGTAPAWSASPTLTGLTVGNTGLLLRDTAADNTLNVQWNENGAANYTLAILMNSASRSINLGGSLTLASTFITSGANSLTLTTTGPTNVTLPTSGTLAPLNGANTWTAVNTFTPAARSSGVAPYFVGTMPADTAITAGAEGIGRNFTGAIRQHASNTIVALQRENVFAAPTYSFATAGGVITEAVLADFADPVTGTNATLTNSYGIRFNNGKFTGTLTSTVATGTAPFVVTSTTNVANLNASSLNGATFAAPGAIGTTTRSQARFTDATFQPNTANVVNAAVRLNGGFGGGLILEDTGLMGIWSQSSGTEFRFGIGSTSGLTPVMILTASSLSVPVTTDSTSTTTGSGVFSGGVGIAKSLNVGSIFTAGGADTLNHRFFGVTRGIRFVCNAVGGLIDGTDPTGVGSYQPLAIGGSLLTFTNSGTGVGTVTATGLNSIAIGATTPSTGTFTALRSTTGADFAADPTYTRFILSTEGTTGTNVFYSRNAANSAYVPVLIRAPSFALDGAFSAASTTDSTSTTTGSGTVAGGFGIAKTLYVGTGANIAGQLTGQNITFNGPNNGLRVNLSGTISGAVVSWGILDQGTIGSGVTTAYRSYASAGVTAAAAFTLAERTGFYHQDSGIGAGSSITTQIGFYAGALTVGTNNFGFRGAVSAGTGRFNVYMDGTAPNYFAGEVYMGSASDQGAYALQVTGDTWLSGDVYRSGTKVLGARITGYTAMTGTPDKATAYATGSVTLAQLAGRVAQLQADLTTHGLIGL